VPTNSVLLGTWCAVVPQGQDDTLTSFEFFADGTTHLSWTWLTRPSAGANVTAPLQTYGFIAPYTVASNKVVVGPSAFEFTLQDNHLIASNEADQVVFTKVGRSKTPLHKRPLLEEHTVSVGDMLKEYQLIFQVVKERHWPTTECTPTK
jgi:hypothetical protein